jgi:hypothetical protein
MTDQQAAIDGPTGRPSLGLDAITAAWRFRLEPDAIKQDRIVLSSH